MTTRREQALLLDAMTRHDTYLHRYGSSVVNETQAAFKLSSDKMLRQLSEQLDNLSASELTALSRGKYRTKGLKAVRDTLTDWTKTSGEDMVGIFRKRAESLAGAEAGYMADLFDNLIEDAPKVAVEAAALYATAAGTAVTGNFVEEMLEGISVAARRRIDSTIRQGITDGQTNSEIVKAIRGTNALKNKDGVLITSVNSINAIVRTSINHVSTTAYEETYKELGVTEVMFAATLDGRTSKVCASRDGERYKINDSFARPPLHLNCRSRIVPVMASLGLGKRPYVAHFKPLGKVPKDERDAGQVSATTSYGQWFKTQDKAFQEGWLGKSRYELYKSGGYTIDRFVDPLGRELTLDELRLKDRETFKRLFGG